MKKGSTLFLKIIIFLIAIGVFAGMIRFPQTEGRAANLDLISIYADPLIIYIYIASTPFFVGLYQAFKLLNLIDDNKIFSLAAINTLKKIKFSSLILICFIVGAQIYIRFFANGDDPAGPMAIGIIMELAFGAVATAAHISQKLLQNAIDIKSENDLTV
jgi:hypothetical protein